MTLQTDSSGLLSVLELLVLCVESCALSAAPHSQEYLICWKWLNTILAGHNGSAGGGGGKPLTKDTYLQLLALTDRLKRHMSATADDTAALLQPAATALAARLSLQPSDVAIFSEEVVRSQLPALLSQCVSAVEPVIRKGAGAGEWQVISPGPAAAATTGVSGQLVAVPALATVQHHQYDSPVVLLVDSAGGEEEVPEGEAVFAC